MSVVLHFHYRTRVLSLGGVMADAHARLLAARDVLNRAEQAVGLRARDDIEHAQAGISPVLLGPTGRAELIRLLIDVCPSEGWTGVCGVGDIGWEWASQQGMDLDRVLLNAGKDHQVGDLCSLLIEACDVVCLDVPELSGAQQWALAARARSMGRTIVTLRPWPGLSREALRRRMQLVV